MTDTEVKINGKLAGLNTRGLYRFKHDITKLVKPGTSNLLEAKQASSRPTTR